MNYVEKTPIKVRIPLAKVKFVRAKPTGGMTVYFKAGGKRHYTEKWLRDNEVIFLKLKKEAE
jgi:hypothetical protein